MTVPRQFSNLARAMALRVSPSFHRRTVARYWSQTTSTHGDMSDEAFDFYTAAAARLLGPAEQRYLLDYGGGTGDIGKRLARLGFRVAVAEFTALFEDAVGRNGLEFVEAGNVPPATYDVILANNCMFYVHPSELEQEVRRLLRSLKPGGDLWITDTPTLEKASALGGSRARKFLRRTTRVYQPEMGGFFVDGDLLRGRFHAETFDSWAGYRQHFRIRSEGFPL